MQVDTWDGNERAIRSYEKCGVVIERCLRENEYVRAEYFDAVIMGFLRDDWEKSEKRDSSQHS